jgi:regulator of PEP synthase PpsR (kinase-PPPase family)
VTDIKTTIFFVSDRTGITAETLGRSLLTQFDGLDLDFVTLPYVDSTDALHQVVEQIRAARRENGRQPVVFSTLVDPRLRERLSLAPAVVLDLFGAFMQPLEEAFRQRASGVMGLAHGMGNNTSYEARMDAVNFAQNNDDGISTRQYDRADIILVGVSRVGKTPTCLYLALQYGLYAANYPLTEDDLGNGRLPKVLQPYRDRLYALSIAPERLREIRQERRPDSRYASLKQCRMEVEEAEALYRREGLPMLLTTSMSVEEIATTIVHRRRLGKL